MLATELQVRNSRKRRSNLATLGELLKRQRKIKGLRQADLAKLVESDASYVGRVERGEIKSPGIESLRRFAEALDLPISALTTENDRAEVEAAIMSDKRLDDEAKHSLVRMYRALAR